MSNEHAPTGGEGTATDAPPSAVNGRSIDIDGLFEVLADRHRRRVLEYLGGTDDGVAAFSELVEHVAESDGDSTDDHGRVEVDLHHNHLPKLDDENLVEYDSRSKTVRYRAGPAVGEWVEFARSYESGRRRQ
ncbi:hypothetical protein [Halorussus sp. MSC15.2]|uniref:DUF7344 domain-containing protein n=1 Tax=Halorussus sp. MSC15.2 TaxID=2283638 RepID=UPI0013D09186|nr:hypothetical protein [Halorussus sp. MSC15.2]NEU57626.1 hypothetical protein [Halorussus sp. MSC15.2]